MVWPVELASFKIQKNSSLCLVQNSHKSKSAASADSANCPTAPSSKPSIPSQNTIEKMAARARKPEEGESAEILKPRNDKREYRRIVLDNSLQVLLISDPETDKVSPVFSFLWWCFFLLLLLLLLTPFENEWYLLLLLDFVFCVCFSALLQWVLELVLSAIPRASKALLIFSVLFLRLFFPSLYLIGQVVHCLLWRNKFLHSFVQFELRLWLFSWNL